MPVTVLYPEARQQPDNLETEVFGPDLRIVKRDTGALSQLSDTDCAVVSCESRQAVRGGVALQVKQALSG